MLSTRLHAQIVKEMLSLLRDRSARIILIAPPIMQLLIFAYAITFDVKNTTVAIYNRDSGYWSQEFIAALGAANFVKNLITIHSPEELKTVIDNRDALVAVQIQEDFSRDIAAGKQGTVQVIVDGRRANAGQIALGYIQQIAQQTGNDRAQASPVATRYWFNPSLDYHWYVVPGLSGILTFILALVTAALSIARERELGTFDQLLVSPCSPTEIIIAKTIPSFIVGSIMSFFMIAVAVWMFSVPFTGSLLLLTFALMAFILAVVGIGLMISAFCATQQQAVLGVFGAMVPMVLMSGFATPVENMPRVLQWLAEAIPFKHYLIVVHGSFLKAMPPADILANTWPMLVIALVTFGLATVLVRSRLQ